MSEPATQEQEFDIEEAAAPVTVKQTTGIDPHQMVTVKMPVSEVANLHRNGTAAPRPAPAPLPPPRKPAEINSKEFLEDLLIDPMSINYSLAVHRYAPPDVTRGLLMTVPLMPLDALHSEIVQTWGGGAYRAVVVDSGGQPVVGMNFKACINLVIPTSQVPAKNEKFEKQLAAVTSAPVQAPVGDAAEEIRRIRDSEQLEDIRFKAEEREQQRSLRRLELAKQLKALTAPEPVQNNGLEDKFLSALKEISTNFQSAIKDLNAKIDTVAAANAQNNQQSMLATAMESQSKIVAAALTHSKTDGNDSLKQLELFARISQKDNALQNQIVNNLMTMMQQPKEQMTLKDTLEMAKTFMNIGESKFTNAMKVLQEQGGDADDPNVIAALAGATPGKKMEAGWMDVAQSLLANPAIAPIVGVIAQKIFGSANPQQQDFDAAAARARSMPRVPPMLPAQQQPQLGTFAPIQQPQQFHVPAHQNAFIVPPAPQQTFTATGAALPPPSAPAATPIIPAAPAPAPAQQPPNEAAIAQAAGHTDTTTQDQTLEGEPDPVDSEGDLEEGDPRFDSEDPNERLRGYVTATMRIALLDMQDKRNAREWMQDAWSYWTPDFMRRLAALPRDHGLQIVSDYTDKPVWEGIVALLQADGNEMQRFFQEWDSLMQEVKKSNTQSAPAAQSQAASPALPVAETAPVAEKVEAPAPTAAATQNQAIAAELVTQ